MGVILFKKSKMRYAIEECDIKAMQRLLDSGLDPNVRDDYGRSFLYHAVELGNHDAVELLLRRGAVVDADSRASRGSLLHIAAELGSVEIMDMLLAKNPALLDRKNSRGNTPLHLACMKGHFDAVTLLVSRGANMVVKNFENRTPIFFAEQERHTDVVDYIKARLPEVNTKQHSINPVVSGSSKPASLAPQAPYYNGWKKMDDQRIAHVSTETAIGYRLTDIFNFRLRERLRIVQNLETRVETMETTAFESMADRGMLEQARQQLLHMGGSPAPLPPGGLHRKKFGRDG